jgi:hypothetical protein
VWMMSRQRHPGRHPSRAKRRFLADFFLGIWP